MLRKMAMIFGMVALTATTSEGRELRVATWNLGWHMSKAMSANWVQKCSAPFQWNEKTGLWEPGTAGPSGWELKWGRDAKIAWDISVLPPCDVFQVFHDVVPVTTTAYDKRDRQISSVLDKAVQPDVIAFQEVSGEDAVSTCFLVALRLGMCAPSPIIRFSGWQSLGRRSLASGAIAPRLTVCRCPIGRRKNDLVQVWL